MPGERVAPSTRTRDVLMPAQLYALLDSALQWEFEIFQLEMLSGQRPLLYLGMKLFQLFEVPQTLHVDVNTMHNWLSVIEMNYRATNWYHNSTHAADAMQTCAMFLQQDLLKRVLNPLDRTCCLLAAAVHDVDHPGRTNAFMCNSDHALAILYNDISVLESHHVACAFRLTLSDERLNIFKGLQRDVYKRVRFSIVDMVLATDMSKHFEHLGNFVKAFFRQVREGDQMPVRDSEDERPLLQLAFEPEGGVMTAEHLAFVKRIIIKCADVSNPTRPLALCVEWALRISEEYFQQTDEETNKNLPLALPAFERTSCSIPKCQIGFMDFIVRDMFEAWERFIRMPVLMENLTHNYQFWTEKEHQGIRLLEDFLKLMSANSNGSEVFTSGTTAEAGTSLGDDTQMTLSFPENLAYYQEDEDREEHCGSPP